MRMSEILLQAAALMVMICAALGSAYVIPFIRRTAGGETMAEIAEWAERAVLFAQQTMQAKTGAERKTYVLKFLTQLVADKKCPITEEQIDILIESAVKGMKIAEGGTGGQSTLAWTDLIYKAGDDLK